MKVKRLVAKTSLLLPPPGSSILAQTTLCHPAACKTILGRGDLLSLLSSLLPQAPPSWYKPPSFTMLVARQSQAGETSPVTELLFVEDGSKDDLDGIDVDQPVKEL